jgi:sugar diacid utilization regulator
MALCAADRERSPERAALVAFRDLASALAAEHDLDAVFHMVVDTLVELTSADRGSLHLVDRETGLLHGQVAHAAEDVDALVKKLVSGFPGDGFTREILETHRPVLLADTSADPRAVRAAMRRWRARSVLGVPMVLRGEVIGIVCLDREDAAMAVSEFEQELAISFAELAATAINQAQLTAQLRSSLQTQARQLELLQRARRMEDRLTDALLRRGGLREVAEVVADLLGKPCAIYDADLRRMTRGTSAEITGALPGSLQELRANPAGGSALDGLQTSEVRQIGMAPGEKDRRLLVAPIDVDGGRRGYVVVACAHHRPGPLDEVILRRAAHSIALELSRTTLDDEREWHAIESLTGSLIRGDHVELVERARSLGVDLDVPRVVCLLAGRASAASLGDATPQQVARLMTDAASPSAVLAAWSGAEIAMIVEVPADLRQPEAVEWVRERLLRTIAAVGGAEHLYGAVSSVVEGPTIDVRAHREARQVLRCMREHLADPARTILTAAELGAVRVILATVDRDEAERIAADALGTLLEKPSPKSAELLSTLDAFVRVGRNVRDCADALGVHPNTVRYRLLGIERRTHLAVATEDNDYMTAQIATVILRLHGRMPAAEGQSAERIT